jgi:pSer/pThr/pTyr-binding forkhead associated (FHA) protein
MTEPIWILRTVDEVPAQTFRMLPGETKTMGRATGTDFTIEAPLVSRVHCRLEIAPSGDLEVRDLGSRNGTFVNDERVEVAQIKSGDRLRIGRVDFIATRESK